MLSLNKVSKNKQVAFYAALKIPAGLMLKKFIKG